MKRQTQYSGKWESIQCVNGSWMLGDKHITCGSRLLLRMPDNQSLKVRFELTYDWVCASPKPAFHFSVGNTFETRFRTLITDTPDGKDVCTRILDMKYDSPVLVTDKLQNGDPMWPDLEADWWPVNSYQAKKACQELNDVYADRPEARMPLADGMEFKWVL